MFVTIILNPFSFCNLFQLYYSLDTDVLHPEALEGKCEVWKKNDMPSRREYPISEHIFFCEQIYDPSKGSVNKVYILLLLLFAVIFLVHVTHL